MFIGLIAVAVGPVPAGALYLARYWPLFDGAMREHILVRGATIVFAGGVLIGAGLGAGLHWGRSGTGAAWRRMLFASATTGVSSAIPSAWIVWQFGPLSNPYFGGPETYVASALTGLVLSVGFIRLEAPAIGWVRRLIIAVKPLPLIFLVFGLAWLAAPRLTSLDLDALRAVALQFGLAPLGAAVGGCLGGVIGLWIGGCAWLAAREGR